jgi:hypothetical protein
MRILVVVLIVALGSSVPAAAQMSYGVKAGANFADVSFDGNGDVPSSGRVAPLAGAFLTIPLRGWLSVQPEIVYTIKGASLDVAGIDSDLIVDYLEAPLLVKVPVGGRFYLATGPSMAFRLRARSRTSFGGSTEEIDLDDDVESFDLGVVGAAGVVSGRWVFDGRYTHGLSDTDADTSDDLKIRNRVFSLSAGIRF